MKTLPDRNLNFITRPYQLLLLQNLPMQVNAVLIRGDLTSDERRSLDQITIYDPSALTADVPVEVDTTNINNDSSIDTSVANYGNQVMDTNGTRSNDFNNAINAAWFEVQSTNHLMQTVSVNGYKTGGYPASKMMTAAGNVIYQFTITNTVGNDFRYEGVILVDANTKMPFHVSMLNEFVNLVNREALITINVFGDLTK